MTMFRIAWKSLIKRNIFFVAKTDKTLHKVFALHRLIKQLVDQKVPGFRIHYWFTVFLKFAINSEVL